MLNFADMFRADGALSTSEFQTWLPRRPQNLFRPHGLQTRLDCESISIPCSHNMKLFDFFVTDLRAEEH